jgi:hypothetical protein
MSQLITDEMVEVTAQAFYEAEEREVGTLEVHPWDGVIEERREAWKICARAALEAGAPLIAARAQLDLLADLLGKGLSDVEYTVSRYPIRAVPQSRLVEYRNRISRGMKEAT